jgi:hypothetical protein
MSNLTNGSAEWLQWKSAILNRRAATFNLITVLLTAISSIFGPNILSDVFDVHSSAKITSPAGPSVPKKFVLAGFLHGFNKDDVLWAASRRRDDGKYYPQEKACGIFNGDNFDCGEYYLGNQEGRDGGEDFDLIVMRVDIETVRIFSSYQIQKKNNNNKETGITDLPGGAEILDRLQVTRE